MNPDILAKSFDIVQKSASAGDSVVIFFNWKNSSTSALENVEARFFLSSNYWISDSDYELGSVNIESIGIEGETGEQSLTLDLPDASDDFWGRTGKGAYFIGVLFEGETEAFPVERLVNEDFVKIDVDGFPDLAGKSFGLESINSTQVEFNFDIANLTSGDSGSFKVDFYLSGNDYISSDDYFLGSYDVAELAGGSTTGEMTVSFDLPAEDDPFWVENGAGFYHAGMVINADDQVPEVTKRNNSNQRELVDSRLIKFDRPALPEFPETDNLDSDAPDLVMASLDVQSHFADAAGTVDVDFAVGNIAKGSAEPFSVSFYISDNEHITFHDQLLGTYEFTEGLEGGISVSETITQSFTLPELEEEFWRFKGEGSYYIGAIVDTEAEVPEFDETNNSNQGYLIDVDSVLIDDVALVELAPEKFEVTGDWMGVPGGELDLEFAVSNYSDTAAESFEVLFYISNNDYISSDDFLVGSYTVEELSGEASTGDLSAVASLPDASDSFWELPVFGTYYLGMVVDPTNEVAEFTQLNNSNQGQMIDSDAIEVMVEADIVGTNFNVVPEASLDSPLMSGEDFEVEYEISNQGIETVEFSATNFFLFTEDYLNNNTTIDEEDIFDSNSGLLPLFGDTSSNFIALEPGASTVDKTVNLAIPEDLATGFYYVGMLNDEFDEVMELNEENNSLTGEFLDFERVYVVGDDVM